MMGSVGRIVAVAVVVVGLAGSYEQVQATGGQNPPASVRRIQTRIEGRMAAIERTFDAGAALHLVRFMDGYWRLAANPGFRATVDQITARLRAGGFADPATPVTGQPAVWVETFGHAEGWDHSDARLTLLGDGTGPDETVLSRDQHRVTLCINSFSTPAGGVTARIVDVGSGASEQDYAKVDVRGAVVLGDAGTGRLFQEAVVRRGALGVVSTTLEDYISPDRPGTTTPTPRTEWDILQWSSIPYDAARRAFGFKATPRAAARIRARLAVGDARVRVDIVSSFSPGPVQTVVAEIPGATLPDERIVLAAHIQEPGANDDSSGCATQLELARAMVAAIAKGTLPRPARTITFLWVDEIRGTRQWLQDHPAEARLVRYAMALDMTGEETSQTGGTFRIEKMPDPTAVWTRPSDPHTEWGGRPVPTSMLRGSVLNDVLLATCRLRASRTGWVVDTNPYEGGSDHVPFLTAKIPAVLAWHFPDRFYHTNLDRPERTSLATMTHVAVSVGAAVSLLASSAEADTLAIVRTIEAAARDRLTLERRQGSTLVNAATDAAAAAATERDVLAAWITWYREALDELPRLVEPKAAARVRAAVAQARGRIR